MIEVENLFLYPIKGCRGCRVTHLDITDSGAAKDREYMLVDSKGKFISQRTHPKLALIHTLVGYDQVVAWTGELPHGKWVIIDLKEPEEPAEGWSGNYPHTVTIHGTEVTAFAVQNEKAQQFFNDVLGIPCTLVRFMSHTPRVRKSDSLRRELSLNGQDGHHLLVVSNASLRELNRRSSEPIPTSRFRPNIVVKGCEAHAEDEWKVVRRSYGGAAFEFAKLCDRCSVPQVRDDGTFGKEPARTLATYRRRLVPNSSKVFFGSSFAVTRPGQLRLGDELWVT